MSDQLEKLRPALILLAVLIVAAVLGYLWGASGTRIVDAGPWQLETGYLGMYVQATADAYALDGNDSLALNRLSFLCQEDGDIEAGADSAAELYGADPAKLANLDQLMTLAGMGVAENEEAGVCNNRPVGGIATIGRILAPLLLFLLAVGIIGYGLWTTGTLDQYMEGRGERTREEPAERPAPAARPSTAPPARPAAPPAAEDTAPTSGAQVFPAEEEEDEPQETKRRSPLSAIPGFGRRREREETAEPPSAAAAGARISRQAEKTDFEAIGQEPPLVQFMTTYLHGDDLYDDSFSIESASGEFLGETGVGISETVDTVAEAKDVTALEVWLFDKNDIRTVTKVLMSDFAFNDETIRARLAPKGEAVLAQAGKKVLLQTATLRVQARIVDLSYAEGTVPADSVIERVTIELAAWRRNGQGDRPASSGGSAFDYDFPPRGNLPD